MHVLTTAPPPLFPTGEPKRPANAYMHFMASQRAAVKAEHPTADMGAVSRIVSERWKALDEDARKPYEQVRSSLIASDRL